MLDGEDADRAFESHNRYAREAVEAFLASFGLVEEGRVLGRFGEVEDSSLGGNRSDQALAEPQPRHVHRFLAKAVGCEQFEEIVAQQIDGADVAIHLVGDEVDNLVELALCRAAPGHDLVKADEYLAGGGGGGGGHRLPAIR